MIELHRDLLRDQIKKGREVIQSTEGYVGSSSVKGVAGGGEEVFYPPSFTSGRRGGLEFRRWTDEVSSNQSISRTKKRFDIHKLGTKEGVGVLHCRKVVKWTTLVAREQRK